MRTDRRHAERRGRAMEAVAACYLLCKGYRLLARRVRLSTGELDLIVRRGNTIAFVEVKTRHDPDEALASVDRRKGKRMYDAARSWLARNVRTLGGDYRFDIVVVSPYHWPRHIENAFGAELW
jgi:putative endonuclease